MFKNSRRKFLMSTDIWQAVTGYSRHKLHSKKRIAAWYGCNSSRIKRVEITNVNVSRVKCRQFTSYYQHISLMFRQTVGILVPSNSVLYVYILPMIVSCCQLRSVTTRTRSVPRVATASSVTGVSTWPDLSCIELSSKHAKEWRHQLWLFQTSSKNFFVWLQWLRLDA